MGRAQPLRTDEPAGDVHADVAHYWRDGYAVVRGFFDIDEIEQIGEALDQLYNEGVGPRAMLSPRQPVLQCRAEARGPEGEALVRMVQWPSLISRC